jgi:hypothetical protein
MTPEKQPREVFRIPEDATQILTEITARARLATGAKIAKTRIITELLYLLKAAKINTKKINSVEDVIEQFKEHIRKKK